LFAIYQRSTLDHSYGKAPSDTQDPEVMQTFTSAVSDLLLHHTVLFSVLVLFAEALSSVVLMLCVERGFDSERLGHHLELSD
jgi:hypothetical protein